MTEASPWLIERQSRTSCWTNYRTGTMDVEKLVDVLLGVEWLADDVLLDVRELEGDYLVTVGGTGVMTVEVDFVVHCDFLMSEPDCARKSL